MKERTLLKIASFNVNGIKARIITLLRWLKETKPDIVILQEFKSTNEAFPKGEIEDLGYNVVTHGQKSFNGVAILSLFPIDDSPVPHEIVHLHLEHFLLSFHYKMCLR